MCSWADHFLVQQAREGDVCRQLTCSTVGCKKKCTKYCAPCYWLWNKDKRRIPVMCKACQTKHMELEQEEDKMEELVEGEDDDDDDMDEQ